MTYAYFIGFKTLTLTHVKKLELIELPNDNGTNLTQTLNPYPNPKT